MVKCPKCKGEMESGFVKSVGAGWICWSKEDKKMYPLWKGLEKLKTPILANRCKKCKLVLFKY